jgi:hypothetical protein
MVIVSWSRSALGFSGEAAGISVCCYHLLLRSPSAPAARGAALVTRLLAHGHSLPLGVAGVLHNAPSDGTACAVVARGLQAQLRFFIVREDRLGLRLAQNIARVHFCCLAGYSASSK